MNDCHLCSRELATPSSLAFVGPDKEEWISLDLRLCADCGGRLAKHLKRGIPVWKKHRRAAG